MNQLPPLDRRGLLRSLAAVVLATMSPLRRALAQDEPSAEPALHDLSSVDELRNAFNGDQGRVRLVLLLSPT